MKVETPMFADLIGDFIEVFSRRSKCHLQTKGSCMVKEIPGTTRLGYLSDRTFTSPSSAMLELAISTSLVTRIGYSLQFRSACLFIVALSLALFWGRLRFLLLRWRTFICHVSLVQTFIRERAGAVVSTTFTITFDLNDYTIFTSPSIHSNSFQIYL